jgi:hypothetical protein
MWPGYSLGEKEVNDTYLSEIEKIVNELGESGIYTLLDMHQDLLTEYFCGEGMPDYLIGYLPKVKDFPWPLDSSMNGSKPEKNYCLSGNLLLGFIFHAQPIMHLRSFITAIANSLKNSTTSGEK